MEVKRLCVRTRIYTYTCTLLVLFCDLPRFQHFASVTKRYCFVWRPHHHITDAYRLLLVQFISPMPLAPENGFTFPYVLCIFDFREHRKGTQTAPSSAIRNSYSLTGNTFVQLRRHRERLHVMLEKKTHPTARITRSRITNLRCSPFREKIGHASVLLNRDDIN